MSTKVVPPRAAVAAPSDPSNTASTSCVAVTMLITTSLAAPSAAGVGYSTAPAEVSAAAASGRLA